ncbi:RDD family protein [candidate division WWE3 bacterium]|nr:RDD family protein [candidate division WWE3 bacterium]
MDLMQDQQTGVQQSADPVSSATTPLEMPFSQGAAPPSTPAGSVETAGPRYGSFIERLAAFLIDLVVVIVIGTVVGFVFGLAEALLKVEFVKLISGPVGYLIAWGYPIYFIGSSGATLGKRVLKLKVTKADGSQPTYVDAVLRELVGKSISALILFIGYLFVLWDPKKQALHDKIANTVVIKT